MAVCVRLGFEEKLNEIPHDAIIYVHVLVGYIRQQQDFSYGIYMSSMKAKSVKTEDPTSREAAVDSSTTQAKDGGIYMTSFAYKRA